MPTQDLFIDWGHDEYFITEVGVGECAGVMIDLVHTLLLETEEKLSKAQDTFNLGLYADSIYHSYAVFISTAKALLTAKDVSTNSQHGIIGDFDRNFVETNEVKFADTFKTLVMGINKNEPTQSFAASYLEEAKKFLALAFEIRKSAQIVDLADKVLEEV